METLVLFVHQRSISKGRIQNQTPLNCRSYHSESGILPFPISFSSSPRENRRRHYARESTFSYLPSPRTDRSLKNRNTKSCRRSSPIPIETKRKHVDDDISFAFGVAEFFPSSPSSERWAGPTYSNSPPPSSLPIPRFSLQETKNVSPELPGPEPKMLQIYAKSAPPSPSRDSHSREFGVDFLLDTASATKDLRLLMWILTKELKSAYGKWCEEQKARWTEKAVCESLPGKCRPLPS